MGVRYLLFPPLLLLLCCLAGVGVTQAQDATATPTVTDTPAATATPYVTETPVASETPTTTVTNIPTRTWTVTPTETATATITLTPTAAPVTPTPSLTPFVPPTPVVVTQVVTQPPVFVTVPPVVVTQMIPASSIPARPPVILPSSTPRPSDLYGWQRSEAGALVTVTGDWYIHRDSTASAGGYLETLSPAGTLRLPFGGEGVRIGYIAHHQGGSFEARLDDQRIAIFNTYIDEDSLLALETQAVFFAPGYHVLDIVALTAPDHNQSVGIDYVEVFQGPPLPEKTVTPAADEEDTRIPLTDVRLVSAPPAPSPSPSPLPETPLTIEVIVGYDLNANGQIEPNEGIRGLSIRVVDAHDNTLLASALTDSSGFVRVQALTSGDVVALIPLLGETFKVRRTSGSATWTLRLDPANVPGLIP